MDVDLEVGREGQRDLLARMGEVDVLRSLAVGPAHAQHVSVGKEGVRSDEQATGAEESVVGEALHHLEMLRQHRRVAERDR